MYLSAYNACGQTKFTFASLEDTVTPNTMPPTCTRTRSLILRQTRLMFGACRDTLLITLLFPHFPHISDNVPYNIEYQCPMVADVWSFDPRRLNFVFYYSGAPQRTVPFEKRKMPYRRFKPQGFNSSSIDTSAKTTAGLKTCVSS